MKRSLSDSDSDDVFDDDGIKASSPSQSCQVSDRKKRRGIIEKRRRDRINCSLSELRRLVPTAFEKQGSAKLEKAEILQMTVDHLKMLHQKGINGYNYPDPQALAMDYRAVGFRECAAEIARYLVSVEGMDLQDPLRMRLLGHLQCFSAQREVVSKTSITNQTTAWSSVGTSHHQYNAAAAAAVAGSAMHITPTSMLAAAAAAATHHVTPSSMDTSSLHPGLSSLGSSLGTPVSGAASGYNDSRLGQMDSSNSLHSHTGARLSGGSSASGHSQMSVVSSSGSQGVQQISPSMLSTLPPQFHSQFPTMSSLNSMMSPPPGATAYSVNNSALMNQASSVRPYRPWGAELAY